MPCGRIVTFSRRNLVVKHFFWQNLTSLCCARLVTPRSIDKQLGRWQLLEKRGTGATACVFGAVDTHTGVKSAVKVFDRRIKPAVVGSKLLKEADCMRKIDHPHVLHLLDVIMENTPSKDQPPATSAQTSAVRRSSSYKLRRHSLDSQQVGVYECHLTKDEKQQLRQEEQEALQTWRRADDYSRAQRNARALAIEWADNGELFDFIATGGALTTTM